MSVASKKSRVLQKAFRVHQIAKDSPDLLACHLTIQRFSWQERSEDCWFTLQDMEDFVFGWVDDTLLDGGKLICPATARAPKLVPTVLQNVPNQLGHSGIVTLETDRAKISMSCSPSENFDTKEQPRSNWRNTSSVLLSLSSFSGWRMSLID